MFDDVKTMKDKMLEEGATNAQTGHFYVQNKPQSDNQGNNLYVQFSLEICKLYCNSRQIFMLGFINMTSSCETHILKS